MAASVSLVRSGIWPSSHGPGQLPGLTSRPTRWAIVTITPDTHYDLGGIDCDLLAVLPGWTAVLDARCGCDDTYSFMYDITLNKLIAQVISTGAEVAHTVSLSTHPTNALVFGY